MRAVELQIAGTHFQAGEEIAGVVSWSGGAAPREVVVRLFWHTKGKGDCDSETVWEKSFDAPLAEDRREFSLDAPASPPSFSGRLISLLWSLELVIDGNGEKLVDIVIAPGGVEVDLQRPEWIAMEAPWDKLPWLKGRK